MREKAEETGGRTSSSSLRDGSKRERRGRGRGEPAPETRVQVVVVVVVLVLVERQGEMKGREVGEAREGIRPTSGEG